jgi:hypothetical protein
VWQGSERVETGIVTITLTGGQTDQLHASLGLGSGQSFLATRSASAA